MVAPDFRYSRSHEFEERGAMKFAQVYMIPSLDFTRGDDRSRGQRGRRGNYPNQPGEHGRNLPQPMPKAKEACSSTHDESSEENNGGRSRNSESQCATLDTLSRRTYKPARPCPVLRASPSKS